MAGHQGKVTVSVSIGMVNESLIMRVTNTMAPDRAVGAEGIGIKNVRERMAVQFEGRASLLAMGIDSEWVSEITMPAVRESPPIMREAPAANKLHTTTLLGT
jgi:hypothetical protein